jgi:hypothetical protein
MKTSKILESAAFVIMTPSWWAQGTAARNASNKATASYNQDACKFCAIGAIMAAANEHYLPQQSAIRQCLKSYLGCDIMDWNDNKDRTAAEVAEMMWVLAQDRKALGD